ncbi:MAG: phosphoenolpyruvate--protein phosphotransferase [Clostridia bacterium]|nr:phosphoenolpyruvate--protein phosphotransferase [Clostridia bacterium]
MEKSYKGQRIFTGIGITSKKASGRLRLISTNEGVVQNKGTSLNKDDEKKRFLDAVKRTIERTNEIAKRAKESLGESEAQIFEIHAMLLDDEDFIGSALGEISKGKSAEEAVTSSAQKYTSILRAIGDEYLSARASDIKDICSGIIDTLSAKTEKGDSEEEPYILVARDLTPSQTVKLDKSKILGFVTYEGTPSSHTSILARAMGIPAIVGVGELPNSIIGTEALLDAKRGRLIACPSDEERERFLAEYRYESKIASEHERYMRSLISTPAVTRSGHRVLIYANVGNEGEVDGALLNGAEGIGLLRSEFMYFERDTYPSETELFSSYKRIAEKMQGKRVIIRTLDVGADKQIPYFNLEKEQNPALGYRGIRICLDRRELFKIQLRAILRASHYGKVGIMMPMIATLGELKRAKELLFEAMKELDKESVMYDEKIEIGIMIETPASAIISDKLAKEVSFFSVGTNDLTQYTLAVDRQNSRVSGICADTEAVMRLIKMATDNIHEVGGWIGVCGEMAADLSLTQAFVDIGVDELSVSAPYLLGVRGKVTDSK